MTERSSIKSIANDLGISHMTVSRALSNSPKVHKDTKAKILKRAAELGYVRCLAAVAMRGDSTRIVGLILPNITNAFYSSFANAMANACDAEGLHLVIHLSDDDPARERHAIGRLREVQAFALVVVPAPGRQAPYPDDVSCIELIRTRALGSRQLVINDTPALLAAVAHLHKHGHRRIAYIGGEDDLSTGRDRFAAFCQGMAAAGLPIDKGLILRGSPSQALGLKVATLLDRSAPPTALICGGFEISNGALAALLSRKLTMPDDLAFVGYGDPRHYEWIQGGVTTISLPVADIARAAANCLISLRDRGAAMVETMSNNHAFPAKLVLRHSALARRSRAETNSI